MIKSEILRVENAKIIIIIISTAPLAFLSRTVAQSC